MKSKKNNDVIYGSVELDPDTFAAHNVKERITTLVDQDALEAFKAIAKEKNVKYQTLLNQLIRSYVETGGQRKQKIGSLTEERVRRIVRDEMKRRA